MNRTFTRLPLLALALFALTATATRAATPEATAAKFYRWYLGELNKGHEPLRKSQGVLKTYVTKQLLQSIKQQMNSEDGLDADPFIQAQDWSKEWAKNTLTTRDYMNGPVASVTVIMTSSDMGTKRIRVDMKKEGQKWLISRVIMPQ